MCMLFWSGNTWVSLVCFVFVAQFGSWHSLTRLVTCLAACRGYSNGHRGIWLERGQDNLLSNFIIYTKMYHDISVSFYEHSTAFVNGTGKVRTGGGATTACRA
jgi:hypothetical protein